MTTEQPPIPDLVNLVNSAPDADVLRLADAQAFLYLLAIAHVTALLISFISPYAQLSGGIFLLVAIISYGSYKSVSDKGAILLSALTFVPLFGLFVLVGSISIATKRLRTAGLRVGFMGVTPADRKALREAIARDTPAPTPPTSPDR